MRGGVDSRDLRRPAPAGPGPWDGLSALGRFLERKPPRVEERCDLCAEPVPGAHRHLLEAEARRVHCVCRACSILFDRTAAAMGHLRLIPERRLRLSDFQVTDEDWQRLGVPVGLAYLTVPASGGPASAWYPGPAGAIDAQVEWAAWDPLCRQNPVLETLEPEVEALLVNRIRPETAPARYYLAPIDECFRLVGIVRTCWRGLTGGTRVWEEVERFFQGLDCQAREPVATTRSERHACDL